MKLPNLSVMVLGICCFGVVLSTHADEALWRDVVVADTKMGGIQRLAETPNRRDLEVDLPALNQLIQEGMSSPSGSFLLALPSPDGGFQDFEFRASKVMSTVLAAKYPSIQAFTGQSVDRRSIPAQLEVTAQGISAQILESGNRWMIDPSNRSSRDRVVSYFARDLDQSADSFQCQVSDKKHDPTAYLRNRDQFKKPLSSSKNRQARSRGSQVRTYRLAVATTGEYGAYHGGTTEEALSAVVRTINRVDGIFRVELSVGLQLIGNNDVIVYTDPDTDPFEGNDDSDTLIEESQSVITDNIGSENFDLGHTFSTGAGGVAATGPCDDDTKARGITGLSSPEGDKYDVDYVAHEIGHQLSMNHTFNGVAGNCGDNRAGTAAFEPGAGSTIMGYAGNCGADDLQANSDAIFHSFSFEEAANLIEEGQGANCGTLESSGNVAPSSEAGPNYTVPAETALVLDGSGSDSDDDSLTYLWEQRDLGAAGPLSAADDGSIPLFRVFTPVSSAKRYLPKLETVVSGEADYSEKVPVKSRTMDFALTARDGRGGVTSDTMQVEVVAAPLVGEPFSLAEPNEGGESLGSIGTVRWNIAETDSAPVSAAQVELYLSTDGGVTFSNTPFAATANDGYARVSFPSGVQTNTARIMLKGKDNIFFDVTDKDFSLNSNASATPEVPAPTNVGLTAGDGRIDITFSAGSTSGVNRHDVACIGAPSSQSVSGSASPGLDFDGEAVTSSIILGDVGVIPRDGLQVTVDISFAYRGDVRVELTSPSGITAQLKADDYYDDAADIKETYTTTAFAGEAISGSWMLTVTDLYEGYDSGTFNSWNLSGIGLTPPRMVSGSATPDQAITKGSPVNSSISLTADGVVSADVFEVTVDISHTYRGDLVLELESPGGKAVTLKESSTDDSTVDISGTYPTTLIPANPLTGFVDESLAGNWVLRVTDTYEGDDGVLNSWSIRQDQYTFTGSGSGSPVTLQDLPNDSTYTCSIAGVYTGVTPSRQSESKSAGSATLQAGSGSGNDSGGAGSDDSGGGTGSDDSGGGSGSDDSRAEAAFSQVLQTILGFLSSAAESPKAETIKSRAADEDSSSVKQIPVLSPFWLSALMVLISLVGIGFQRQFRRQAPPRN
tara:strand:+ start:433 stop:3795 length:3363 start_codon:yes stop_codon:yes gene_type:complete